MDGVAQTRKVERLLHRIGMAPERVRLVADPVGQHREADWARRLPEALLWLA